MFNSLEEIKAWCRDNIKPLQKTPEEVNSLMVEQIELDRLWRDQPFRWKDHERVDYDFLARLGNQTKNANK